MSESAQELLLFSLHATLLVYKSLVRLASPNRAHPTPHPRATSRPGGAQTEEARLPGGACDRVVPPQQDCEVQAEERWQGKAVSLTLAVQGPESG